MEYRKYPHEVTYNTSADFDKSIMDYFQAKIDAGEKITTNSSDFEEYKLKDGYNLFSNNCTTMCLGAINHARKKNPDEKAVPPAVGTGARDPAALNQELATGSRLSHDCRETGCKSGSGFVIIP